MTKLMILYDCYLAFVETPVKLGYSLIWLGLVYVNLRRSVTP
jgi:hypothetical protein